MLANQFVSGLRADLKAKVVGTEGSLEQLLVKARFEEAKRRELAAPKGIRDFTPRKPPMPPNIGTVAKDGHYSKSPQSGSNAPGTGRQDTTAWKCGMPGHLARACPYPRPNRRDHEAKGHPAHSVSAVRPVEAGTPLRDLREQLQEAELAEAVRGAQAVIYNVSSYEGSKVKLGPTVLTQVEVNGTPTDALVDTGSPMTIASLEFVMQVLGKERPQYHTSEEWETNVMKKFSHPEITLTNYGGHRLDIMAKIQLGLKQAT